jgi:hypothetical protein
MRGEELLAEGRRLREELRLPRWVFLKLDGERKPFVLDFESVFGLEVFANALRDYGGTISFTEMMPSPSELWLDFGEGTHTCELRFIASVEGRNYSGNGYHLSRRGLA